MGAIKEESSEIEIQRRHYANTALRYDSMHITEGDEHSFALSILLGAIDFLKVKSILDVGSGTGRAVRHLKAMRPELFIKGIEPVRELREVAYSSGLCTEDVLDGNALGLQFADGEFDLVCEFGILHHIRTPELAVSEMLRVAKKAVFISDSNNFGQGSRTSRIIKQTLNAMGLWSAADMIKTRGRGYVVLPGDGPTYSYSVFNSYEQIKTACERVHVTNTSTSGINPYRTASHVALLGLKKD